MQRITHLNQLDTDQVYYLASPYSTPIIPGWLPQNTKNTRWLQTERVAAQLIKQDFILIEPISMCHKKSISHALPSGFDYWQRRDYRFIDKSDALLVVGLDKWDESEGVNAEINYAFSQNKPVYLVTVDDPGINLNGEIQELTPENFMGLGDFTGLSDLVGKAEVS